VCSPGNGSLAETAQRVVDEARAVLVGSERGGVHLETLFHYCAVDIDPQHLVVWILLSGKPDDQLPEWVKVDQGLSEESQSCQIDYQWLTELRGEIVRRFAAANWPMPERIDAVYADSSHRVKTHGGWFYFRG